MNAKQRRQHKRRLLRIATEFTDMIEQLIDDLESGKQTFEQARHGLAGVKESLSKA